MLERQIRELGQLPFARMITPRKTMSTFPGDILGFDTESVSGTGEYLSTQLAYGDRAKLFCDSKTLTVDRLAGYVRALGCHANQALLVSYASWAELQFLPVKSESFNWSEYGGSFDCTFYSEREGLTLRIFDLARFFERARLADVAKAFGLEKMPWDTSKVTRATLKAPGFKAYAINDAVITLAIFNALRAEFLSHSADIAVTATPASTAATVFRSEWLPEALENHNSRARYAGMRAAWGGRAEAFQRGHFDSLYEYDLPSAYPNAGIHFGKLPTTKDWKEITSLKGLSKWRGGFADVMFSFPEDTQYPCLPNIVDNTQFYFIRGREWVTFAEIELALEMGADIDLIEGWGFKTGTDTLPGYLSEMLKRREQAQGVRKIAAKLLANALIGKLNQRVHGIDADEIRRMADKLGIGIEDLMSMQSHELEALGASPKISVGACYMPEYNALITGLTRARISKMAADFGALYCATDAIWTRKPIGKARLPYGATLKRQGPGEIFRTRLGRIGDHVVHHAIHAREAARELFDEWLQTEGAITEKTYTKSKPLKLREALRSRRTIGKWVPQTRIASLKWDEKRQLLDDGTTIPFLDYDERSLYLESQR